jgi:hypothetical protein
VIAARFGSFSFNSDGTAGRSEVAQPVRTFTALCISDIYLLFVLPKEHEVFRMVFVISSDHFTTEHQPAVVIVFSLKGEKWVNLMRQGSRPSHSSSEFL